MHRKIPAIVLALIALSTASGCGGDDDVAPSSPAAAAGDRMVVAASVPPLATLVRRVGGDHVELAVLLPPGASPHDFEPRPSQVLGLSRAQLFVVVGHPGLSFEGRFLAPFTDGGDGVEIVSLAAAETAAPEGEDDPHLWLSPRRMTAAAEATAEALARLDPTHRADYEAGRDAFAAEVAALDHDLDRLLAGAAGRRVLVYHPAWGHLLADYGLEQVSVEVEGKETGARRLVDLLALARRAGAPAVFVQRGAAERPARALAAEIGAEVVVVDPLAEDWADNLRRVAELFARGSW
jgi:zinc transport system substrate-binding protein